MVRLAAVSSVLGLASLLSVPTGAAAQVPDVRIAELDCQGTPELVALENAGEAAQDLTGWFLVSDPLDSETYDLSAIGDLQTAASVTVQSGPGAGGAFTWTQDEVFRDGDPTDYVRVLDAAGATVDEAACATAATPSPTPPATATPTPVPNVPNGGGPPPVSGDSLWPTALVLAGGAIVIIGVMASTLPAGRTALTGVAQQAAGGSGRGKASLRLALIGVAAAMAAVFVFRRGRR